MIQNLKVNIFNDIHYSKHFNFFKKISILTLYTLCTNFEYEPTRN